MKETKCDFCKKKFSERDKYVNASILVKYTKYEGDDGSIFIEDNYDLCEVCLVKLRKSMLDIGTKKKK